jgi:hypothetical protein
MTMAMTPLKRPTLDELVAPLLADGLPLPMRLRWALDQAPTTAAALDQDRVAGTGACQWLFSGEVAILKACIGKLTHSGPQPTRRKLETKGDDND